ncbi:MFS transporter [Brenneria izadpanahii]|uniref:MFS transporter n=1 Tax=Brenneria izadpanahii TaxID=2722756 RepID=A0ABX7UWN3_9GAMM|nr:MFS transporter [Brenneria izadpanahii]QTF09017.1 MFS transporter [Brenneria izadpanahii]
MTHLAQQQENIKKKKNVRYYIILMLFIVTSINYGDRAVLAIAGSPMADELNIDSITMGYIFSAFAWAYVIGQIPGGWLLDRYGAKRVYFGSIFFWSLFTLLQGFIFLFHGITVFGGVSLAVVLLFTLRFIVGLAECPAFPGNSKIVSSWFPQKERATASAIFNSAQYFATAFFAPIMGWLVHITDWHSPFIFMGALGIIISLIWLRVIYPPVHHPRISKEELDYMREGGALVDLDSKQKTEVVDKAAEPASDAPKVTIGMLLSQRLLVGVYLGQYCISTLTWFFISWFPIYLVKERGLTILNAGFASSLPAICGFAGGILGGVISDALLKRGYSLSLARKTPIILGMVCSMSMVLCNYTDSIGLVIFLMSFSFFGKGVGALGWAVVADTSPKEAIGLSGGVFNTIGNIAGIVTPIVIGYIVATSGSFGGALLYVSVFAALAIFCYLFLVGEIKRVDFSAKQ